MTLPGCVGRHARCALFVIGVGVASVGGVAQGQAPEPPTSAASPTAPALEWQAPPGCPEREQVLALVDALARDDVVEWRRFDGVRARVSSRGATWLLELVFVRPSGVSRRRVESPRCADLAQAAAVAIVLAHRADEDAAAEWSDTDSAPSERPQPPASEPAPSAQATTGPPQASPPQPSVPAGWALGARGVLDPTSLGAAALGVALGAEVQLGAWSAALQGVWFPEVETPVATGQAIALGLLAAGAHGCRRWVPGLRTCLGLELGQLRASSRTLEQPSSARDLWVTPNASLELSSQIVAAVAVTADAALLVPLIRGEYRVDEAEVHRVPALAFRAGLGVRVQLLP